MEQLGLLLLASELRAAWTYYQMVTDEIYPKPFSDNKVVGAARGGAALHGRMVAYYGYTKPNAQILCLQLLH